MLREGNGDCLWKLNIESMHTCQDLNILHVTDKACSYFENILSKKIQLVTIYISTVRARAIP